MRSEFDPVLAFHASLLGSLKFCSIFLTLLSFSFSAWVSSICSASLSIRSASKFSFVSVFAIFYNRTPNRVQISFCWCKAIFITSCLLFVASTSVSLIQISVTLRDHTIQLEKEENATTWARVYKRLPENGFVLNGSAREILSRMSKE